MTKIKLAVLGLVTLFLGATISCSKEEATVSNNETKKGIYTERESAILKSHYGFKSVSGFLDKSKGLDLKSFKTNKLTNEIVNDFGNVNLEMTTEMTWENGSISYFVPFKENALKYLVISEDKDGKVDVASAVTIENNVNTQGNGKIIVVTKDGTFERVFKDGKEDIIAGKRTFRQCFDQAYNDVCDGFIGCVAWYSNPTVPLAAAAYCQIHG